MEIHSGLRKMEMPKIAGGRAVAPVQNVTIEISRVLKSFSLCVIRSRVVPVSVELKNPIQSIKRNGKMEDGCTPVEPNMTTRLWKRDL